MEEWLAKWMDKQIDRWIDGWINECMDILSTMLPVGLNQ